MSVVALEHLRTVLARLKLIVTAARVTNCFTQRLAALLQQHEGPVIFTGGSRWGGPYFYRSLELGSKPLIWLELEAKDKDDPIAQGNKLADAVNRAFHGQLFGYAMPYSYGISILQGNLHLFEPISLVLSGADYGLEFARQLLAFQRRENQVILDFTALPQDFSPSDETLILGPEQLALSQDEAATLAADLTETEVEALLAHSHSAFETFMVALLERRKEPPLLRPAPGGAALPIETGMTVPPEALLKVLINRKAWVEALELAVQQSPEQVAGIISEAAEAYLERGLYKRLWQLLSSLPQAIKSDIELLRWRLQAAQRLGRQEALREEVERALEQHEAPDLRAIYAFTLAPRQTALEETRRAYEAAKTPLTLHHQGIELATRSPKQSLAIFQDLVDLVKREAPAKLPQATGLLAMPLYQLGRYHEAASWLEQAIQLFDMQGSGDTQARINMVNNWAFSRILIGETVGLEALLKDTERALRDTFPTQAAGFRSTIGDYLLSQGRAEEAYGYYRTNLAFLNDGDNRQRYDFPPFIVRDAVHCLLHLGRLEQAVSMAQRHHHLTQDETGDQATFATLAYGMVKTLIAPKEALAYLEETRQAFGKRTVSSHLASTCLYLAKAYLSLGKREAAKKALAQGKVGLKELSESGFRLLAGPEAEFRDVYALLQGGGAPLRLNFLGKREVIFERETLPLSPQQCDLLALLVTHPQGLESDELANLLYGDPSNTQGLKAPLSKIRRYLPLSRPPYRLETAWLADFIELERDLEAGNIRAALERYQGSFLPKSDVPAINALREQLEESVRQAALRAGDAEVLLNLSKALVDDLELWEATLEHLPKHDPRQPLVRARYQQVQASW